MDWHFETDLEYLTTIPIHYLDLLTNVTKTRITETTSFRIENKLFFALEDPHSIISIHINHYFPLSTNRNHHHPPSFSPTLQYPISQTTHFFFLIPFIINHSIILRLMDDLLIIRNCFLFLAFIDSISFVDKEYGYRFW